MEPKNKILQTAGFYARLAKYKLACAIAFSSATGYIICSERVDTGLLIVSAGVFLLAAGSAALNQVMEMIPDGIMIRTRGRPLPSGKLSIKEAGIASGLLIVSGSILVAFADIYALLTGLLCIFLYNLLYTFLKPRSALAIVPGALTGALPPVIGFLASGGIISDPRIISFSAFMFLWQLPHFWILLLKYRDDYNRAGFRTICHYMKESQLKLLVFGWVLITSLFLLVFFGISDIFGKYLARIIWLLNPVFILLFIKALFSSEKQFNTKGAFVILNAFGFLVMVSLILDSLLP